MKENNIELLKLHERFIIYNSIRTDETITMLGDLYVNQMMGDADAPQYRLFFSVMQKLICFAENKGLGGNIFRQYIASLLLYDENAFSLACERNNLDDKSSIYQFGTRDIDIAYQMLQIEFDLICDRLGEGHQLLNYTPAITKDDPDIKAIIDADSPQALLNILTSLYRQKGCGDIGRYHVLRFDGLTIKGIKDPDAPRFEEIYGYDVQKRQIIDNTRSFVQGQPANNVLLIGARGTGKSTCVKALVDEFADELRLIEVSRDHLEQLPLLLGQISQRGKHFILFIDDLSFDDFEVQYKYMKSLLEGSVEKRPSNVLFYATSNRRHLIQEKWSDKEGTTVVDGEIHASDTINEKLSLSDRFGLTITFPKPSPTEYYNIVTNIASNEGLTLSAEELKAKAGAWELNQKGLSGRTARQLINSLLCNENSNQEQ